MNVAYPYTANLEEDGAYFVQFRDLEEAFTQGETIEEAVFNAAEVLTGILAYRLDHNQDIPEPSPMRPGDRMATPSVEVQSALLLRQARAGRSLSDLANAMETSWPAVQRLENPHHWPTLKQLDKAARALGKRLVLSLE
ncbi:type II toxin-antitoxin system HicB family antitoxin [Methylomonas sp. SURF-2]|uniref:Type II toxin-antitoxin system HicB family antitoxin n=1 Tax=Methylomonas subterranea TaxID=2952225 RepID=A0ABT1TMF1_9GAMM|nr:type II toxin-antitoxin system HicB family antitoxin [Methylomonas sp. SURF-2]MCQ8106479.1 type II toxin-antitoxin system HicB family antitoxin [Methylomonas sp. SURF-2]